MLLSILVPLYQSAPTVERTLRSLAVIAERARVEVVVIDDGSRDDGAERARGTLASMGFGALTFLSQTNAGSAAARNLGLARSSGEWVVFLDADDELVADPLALVAAAPSAANAVVAGAVVERDGRVVLRYRAPQLAGGRARRVLSAGNPLPISAVVLRRSALVARFDPSLRYLEDWDFWIANAEALFAEVVRRADVVLTRIHAHGANKSSHFEAIGRCRALVAERRLTRDWATLTRGERNNWRLQREIGRVLQGQRPGWRTFLALPANAVLYVKFVAHALGSRRVLAHDPYAKRKADRGGAEGRGEERRMEGTTEAQRTRRGT